MTRHIFREYDIRGVADRDLTDAVTSAIGRGLGRMLRPGGRPPHIVVGRDCRRSGPRLFDALVTGLVDAGAQVTKTASRSCAGRPASSATTSESSPGWSRVARCPQRRAAASRRSRWRRRT